MERKKLDLADLLVLNSVTMLSITLIWRTVEKIIEGKDYIAYRWLKCTLKIKKEEVKDGEVN